MREMLLDVIKHVGNVGFFEYAKFIASESETRFEAMDDERTIILKGRAKEVYTDLEGEFGMARFPILQGFLNFANYKTDNAYIEVKRKETATNSVPEELVFHDENNQTSTYRFMSADLIPDQAKFMGTAWEIDITPSRSKMQEFMQLANIMSAYEKYFLATTQNGNLKFFIGDEHATSDRSSIIIQENVTGELKGELYWDSSMVSTILKLGIDGDLKMCITSKGAMMIKMETPIAEYEYILPARRR